ncbi:MAG: putative O-glycosylation ligase, exosortase A system-associated [Burkholderiales bacterium]|nr:putative O-glycosylation ligase, exosortase A system-associated [Burkholderiales bacterium]
MRDIVLTLIIFGSIPFIFKRPLIGLLMWVWISIMNPHRLAYGFAFSMPFAQVIAICTLLSLLIHARKLHAVPFNAATFALFGFSLWICISPLFPVTGVERYELLMQALKMLLMVLVTFLVVGTRDDIEKLIWVLVGSVAFYGVKGGVFVIMTAGSYRVWGPAGSFIEENNALAIALLCAIPLLNYLRSQAGRIWLRYALLVSMVLCFLSALGSYSRGALIAMFAMGTYFWMKSRHKLLVGVIVLASLPLAFTFMPDRWVERMSTIQTYDEDRSAQGRINAWWNAWNLARDRFPIGGGFNIYKSEVFARYSPIPEYVHAAHSIYFQVLGEHGFGGLALYLLIFGSGWWYGGRVIRRSRGRPDLAWAAELGAMIQVSLIAFGVGGAFLSLTYYDFPYYVVAIAAVLATVVEKNLARSALRADSVGSTTLPAQAVAHQPEVRLSGSGR